MKRIAILVQKLSGGGAERAAANLSMALSKKYAVHLIVFSVENAQYPYGGTLHDLKLPPAGSYSGRILNAIRRIRAVKKLKKAENIDASISLMDGANLVNALSRVNDKVILSVRIHMSRSRFSSPIRRRFQIAQMRLLASRSDAIAAVSQGVKEDLVQSFGLPEKKVAVVPNLCLLTKEDADAPLPSHILTAMGRFTRQKGFWHLIRAFRAVVAAVPDAKLYLIGDGPQSGSLQALAQALDLTENVIFTGNLDAPHRWIRMSRGFVLPSLYEGMPNALLEALACGTPCIASDCRSGSREILAPGTAVREHLEEIEFAQYGILISVGTLDHFSAQDALTADEQQLSEAMRLLLTDDRLYSHYREKSVQRSAAFTPERILPLWEALL